MSARGLIGGIAGVALLLAAPAAAEEWRVLESPSLRVLYQDGNRTEALLLQSRSRMVRADLERDLGLRAPSRITVKILPPTRAASRPGSAPAVPHWAAGYVPGDAREVVLRGDLIRSYPFQDLLSLFGHEMTHVLLNSLPPESGGLPLWFHEGVAVTESRRWSFRDAFTLGTMLLVGSPASLRGLTRAFPQDESAARAAYAESFSFVSHLEREHGPGAVRRILAEMAAGSRFPEAFRRVVGTDLASAERDWRDRVNFAYRWVPALTSTSFLWMAITLLVLFSRVARRRRERAIREAWEREGLG